MKKIFGMFLALTVFAKGAHAAAVFATADICKLIDGLLPVLNMLRTLAFVGAAFVIAAWSWDYIKGGKAPSLDDAKAKGLGMLIGFGLLFGIGMLLQFLPGATGCSFAGW